MKKPKQLQSKMIRKILTDSSFNPKKPGPMKIIVDVGGNDVDYYLKRAIETVHNTREMRKCGRGLAMPKLKMAISLLALAGALEVIGMESGE